MANGRLPPALHPAAATAAYVGFVVVTIVAYLIYEIVLFDVNPHTLLFSGFLIVFLWYLASNPETVRSWRPELSRHIVWYAIFVFTYWYTFWIGINAAKSADLALAFLALVIVVSPWAVDRFCTLDPIRNRRQFYCTSLMLVVGVALVKLNLTSFDTQSIYNRVKDLEWFSSGCFLIAVLAEAAQEVIMTQVHEAIHQKRIGYYANMKLPPGVAIGDVAGNDLILMSYPLCVAMSLLVLLVDGSWPWLPSHAGFGLLSILWFIFWLAVLGLAGTLYRAEVINPLRVSKGLPADGLGPWMAIRLVIFGVAAAALFEVLDKLVTQSECSNHICGFSVYGSYLRINMDFVPEPNRTYYLGAVLIFLAFAVRFFATWRELRRRYQQHRAA